MDMRNLMPQLNQEFWDDILDLGRVGKWFDMEKHPTIPMLTMYKVHWHLLFGRPCNRLVDEIWKQPGGTLLPWLECLGNLVANGPKVFRPTLEQCESMEQVEINMAVTDYRQPFPAMVVEFPKEYREKVATKHGLQQYRPRIVMLRWYEEHAAMFGGIPFDGRREDITYVFQDRQEFPTIEHALQMHVEQPKEDSIVSEVYTRVAMNLMLMLSHYGHTKPVPSNADHLARTERRLKANPTGPHAKINQFEAASHVYVIGLKQQIKVRQDRPPGEPATPHGGTHASPHPHWRKGHWRAQRGFGAARRAGEKVPLSFIKPVLVRGREFGGDLSSTSAVYNG